MPPGRREGVSRINEPIAEVLDPLNRHGPGIHEIERTLAFAFGKGSEPAGEERDGEFVVLRESFEGVEVDAGDADRHDAGAAAGQRERGFATIGGEVEHAEAGDVAEGLVFPVGELGFERLYGRQFESAFEGGIARHVATPGERTGAG